MPADSTDTPALPAQATAKTKKPRKQAKRSELPKDVQRLGRLIKGLKKNKTTDILPDDLTFADVESHYAGAVKRHKTRRKVDAVHAEKREDLEDVQAEVSAALTRLESLLAGPFPDGKEGRRDFFPQGSGPFDELARIAAFVAGMELHPLDPKKMPPDLQPDAVVDMYHRLQRAGEAKQDAAEDKLAVGAQGRTFGTSTQVRQVLSRVGKILRGWHGATSPALAAYGMNPRKPQGSKVKIGNGGAGKKVGKGKKAKKV